MILPLVLRTNDRVQVITDAKTSSSIEWKFYQAVYSMLWSHQGAPGGTELMMLSNEVFILFLEYGQKMNV